MQHKSATTSRLLGGGPAHEMALFTLPRFFKVFSLLRAEAFFKDFASQDCSVDGIYVSFSRNGIGEEQVECHCHLPAKGDVAVQRFLVWLVGWLGFFLFSVCFPSFNAGGTP